MSRHEQNEIVRNRVKILRQKHGLSQQQLADMIGLKQSMINRIETQSSNLTITNAINICKALNEPFMAIWEEGSFREQDNSFDFLGMLNYWQLMSLRENIEKEIKKREEQNKNMEE